MDAICGLAFDDLAVITKPPISSYIGTDMDSRLLKQFAFFLNSDPDDLTMPSHVTFGWHNLSLAGKNAEWNFSPLVTSHTFWTLDFKKFQTFSRTTKCLRFESPLLFLLAVMLPVRDFHFL